MPEPPPYGPLALGPDALVPWAVLRRASVNFRDAPGLLLALPFPRRREQELPVAGSLPQRTLEELGILLGRFVRGLLGHPPLRADNSTKAGPRWPQLNGTPWGAPTTPRRGHTGGSRVPQPAQVDITPLMRRPPGLRAGASSWRYLMRPESETRWRPTKLRGCPVYVTHPRRFRRSRHGRSLLPVHVGLTAGSTHRSFRGNGRTRSPRERRSRSPGGSSCGLRSPFPWSPGAAHGAPRRRRRGVVVRQRHDRNTFNNPTARTARRTAPDSEQLRVLYAANHSSAEPPA
jgi:hypothetical protein